MRWYIDDIMVIKSASEIDSKLEVLPIARCARYDIIQQKFWRNLRPIVDTKIEANRQCAVFCPRNAIIWMEAEKKLKINYDFCDGCLICLRECHSGAIKEEREK